MNTWAKGNSWEATNKAKVSHLQRKEKHVINKNTSRFNNILKVYICRSEKGYVLVQSTALSQRIPLGPHGLLPSPQSCWHTRCYQRFLLRGHSPAENSVPAEGFINPRYAIMFSLCPTMRPSAPLSLSLVSLCPQSSVLLKYEKVLAHIVVLQVQFL